MTWWMRRRAAKALLVGIFDACAAIAQANCTEGCESSDPDGDGYDILTCPDRVLTSQSDADLWGKCANFTGNVIIQSDNLTSIILNGIETITRGSLIAVNSSQLANISAPDLSRNSGNITLSNLPLLTALNFPQLKYVADTLWWDFLPLLTDVSIGSLLPAGSYNSYGDLNISNTGLTNISFYSHFATDVGAIEIKDNPQLSLIDLSSVTSVNTIDIARNGPEAALFLVNMTMGYNISLGNIADIDLRSLQTLEWGNLIIFNSSLETFLAPNLTAVESLQVTGNPQLSVLSMPALSQIGGYDTSGLGTGELLVINNPVLKSIVMSSLEWITGKVVMTGDLLTVSMPYYEDYPVQFYLNSTNPNLNCTKFDKLNYDYLSVKASNGENHTLPSYYNYSCSAYPPGSMKDVALHYHPHKRSLWSKLPKGERVLIVVASIVVGFFVVFFALRWWRKKHLNPQPRQPPDGDGEVVDLGDLSGGVVREEEEDVQRPPQYRRVAKPHEVPPGYRVTLNERGNSEVGRQEANAPPIYTAVHTRRKSPWQKFQTWIGK